MTTSELLVATTARPTLARRMGAQRPRTARRGAVAALALLAAVPLTLLFSGGAVRAADVPDVGLGTAAQYAVLGGSTVTNTGSSTLDGSLGVSPGTSITGFPPGLVLAPWVTNATNAAAQQAQSDLTAAYVDAAGRPLDGTTTADLGGLNLQPGVYAGPSKGALALTGTLILDGAGNPDSVFIFQTNSSLITATGSTVQLINGAQACNIYWQVGSSATLGTGSVFVGTIMALSSISVNSGVTVQGQALARNGAVTLINDVFTRPSCATAAPPPTTTSSALPTSTAGTGGSTTTAGGVTTSAGGVATSAAGTNTSAGGATTVARNASTIAAGPTTALGSSGKTVAGGTGSIPNTGGAHHTEQLLIATVVLAVGAGGALVARRRSPIR